jgi:WD40 repeat protein
MSKIFVSYAREDVDIAEKIINALAENDFDTFIDWKSIPKGEKFEDEIYQGIENAQIFLFLLSSFSAQSEWCDKEIAYAVKNGKRIIPIFVGGKDVETVKNEFLNKEQKKEITDRNLIFGRDKCDEFDEAINQTLETIHADYEWVKYHSRLQVKALEWDKTQDVSRLLRGKELSDTEKQLANVDMLRDPQPTNLQRQFLFNSRKGEGKRQRRTVIGLAFGFIMITIFAVLAWQQRNLAMTETNVKATALVNEEYARAEAERQGQISFARLLAGPAQLLYESENPNQLLPVLLATQSMKAFPLSGTAQILQTHILARSIGQKTDSNSNFSGLFSSDGKWILSRDSDNSVRVWDATLKDEVFRINHDDIINTVAFHPNGKWIAIGSDDNTIQVWNVTTGKKVSQMLHDDEVEEIAFSPDGKWIISGSRDDTARVWETETGIELSRTTNGISVDAVAFSPNGEWVASGGCEELNAVYECNSGIVHIWEAISGKNISQFTQSNRVNKVAFSPDGSFIVLGEGYSLKIWDIVEGDEISQVTSKGWIFAVGVSPDGKKIVTGACANRTAISRPCLSGVANVWDITTGQNIAQMSHDGVIQSVVFSPDGSLVASSSSAKDDVRVWDAETGQEVVHIPNDDGVYFVSFSPDGKKLVSAGSAMISVWDIEDVLNNSRVVDNYNAGYRSPLAFSPDGKWVASEKCEPLGPEFGMPVCASSSVHIWDISTGQEISSILHSDRINSIAFSSNGDRVVSGSKDGIVLVWETSTGNEITRMAHKESVTSVRFSPNNKWVASGSSDNTVRVWDANTGQEISYMLHNDGVEIVVFSEDGNKILTGSIDNFARLWEVDSGQEIARIHHDGPVRAVAFSLNGKWALSGSDDGTARIWDINTGKEISRMAHENIVSAVAFVHNSEWAVSASYDGSIRVWGVVTGQEIVRMVYENSVTSIDISEDEKWIIAGTSCGTLCRDPLYSGETNSVASVWEVATGREVARTIYGGKNNVGPVAFSPTGKWVVSGEFPAYWPEERKSSIHAWIYRSDDLIEYACNHLPRNLTHAEWNQYVGKHIPYEITCPNLPIPEE